MKSRAHLHLAALLLAFLLAGQAFAVSGQAVRVCKFTGKVMAGCPCPQTEESGNAEVERAGCCELRSDEPLPWTVGSLSPQVTSPQVVPASLEQPLPVMPEAAETTLRAKGTSPPARNPLYVELRQLLI